MKILIISHFAGSPFHGMVFRNYVLAKEWIKQGCEVTIVSSGYSHVRSKQPFFKGRIGLETIDSIKYIWVWGPKYNSNGSFSRVFSMLVYTLQCLWLRLPLDDSYDVIVCSSPHPFSIYPAKKIAKRYKACLIYDIRDLWPLTLQLLGNISEYHPFIMLMQQAEIYACKHADLVTSVLQNAKEYLIKKGLEPNKFLHVPNCIDANEFQRQQSLPSEYIKKLDRIKSESQFVIGYAGSLGIANALNIMIKTMSQIPSNVSFVILGAGGEKENLIRLTEKMNLGSRVHFFSSVNREQVPCFLNYLDAGYVATNKPSLFHHGASPTKTLDYMMAGLPILYAVGDPNNSVELSGCGVNCEPGSIESLLQGIASMIKMSKQDLQDMGKLGYEWYMKHQLASVQAKKILDVLKELTST